MIDLLNSNYDLIDDFITIRGEKIDVKRGLVDQNDLNFWTENPRIYTALMNHNDNQEPTQDEIYSKLKNRDHVRSLVSEIKGKSGTSGTNNR